METIADNIDIIETDQYSKARRLIEEDDIVIERIEGDQVVFQINGVNDDYILRHRPSTKESLCECKAQTYNYGDCYHKLAAKILLTKEIS